MRSQYGPAAGTKQGAAPQQVGINFPEVTADYGQEDHLLFNVLHDFAAAGVYRLLTKYADYETGEVPATTYAHLLAVGGIGPRTERGPGRKALTYEQLRRILRDLESVGLVARDAASNAAQGQLRLYLPLRALVSGERNKARAQRQRTQGSPQGQKAR